MHANGFAAWLPDKKGNNWPAECKAIGGQAHQKQGGKILWQW